MVETLPKFMSEKLANFVAAFGRIPTLEELEEIYLKYVYGCCSENKVTTGEHLGISTKTVYNKLGRIERARQLATTLSDNLPTGIPSGTVYSYGGY